MQVLVTDDSYTHSLGIVRSLGQKGLRVSVLTESSSRLASYSRYCSSSWMAPAPHNEGYFEAVVAILRRSHFDLIIPVGYASTAALARHKSELASLSRLEVADFVKIRAAADKRYVAKLAEAAGVPTPKTVCPSSFSDAMSACSNLRYPVVVKAPHESVKRPVVYARSPKQLEAILNNMSLEACHGINNLPIIQEYIPGCGCGFFALYQNGICKRVFMHRRVREVPPSGGISSCAESFHDPRLQEYGTRLLDRLDWHGVAMVEFRHDRRDGEYKLMEINPKFWGSLDLALAAGVDFPYDLCLMAQGRHLAYSDEYNRNLRFHWPLWEMLHLWQRPTSVWAVLLDSFDPTVQSNISLLDLKPNLLEPFSRASAYARRALKERQGLYRVRTVLEKPGQ
jgi:predicted ATP-grasp superfamily ATP-dependent carboligase